jgi:hypothetical protein
LSEFDENTTRIRQLVVEFVAWVRALKEDPETTFRRFFHWEAFAVVTMIGCANQESGEAVRAVPCQRLTD